MRKLFTLVTLFVFATCAYAQEGYLGEIKMFAGNFAPRNWALCDGQLLLINQNQSLFSILGTTYGGDGRTTFALPDLRGRLAVHEGNGPGLSPRTLGQKGGTETETLTVNQMPNHTHALAVTNPVYNMEADSDDPTGKYPAMSGENMYSTHHNAEAAGPVVQIGNTGGNQAINNMQPYTCINYIICLYGLFPPRN
ncbi:MULTISPECIES: phage tail protein [unclassified Saccharicrinis]|uniref:phage tail protein n=1 Tax=unclassified Saccharicrinis TaxID=2646859 RepID=UPI003D357FC4